MKRILSAFGVAAMLSMTAVPAHAETERYDELSKEDVDEIDVFLSEELDYTPETIERKGNSRFSMDSISSAEVIENFGILDFDPQWNVVINSGTTKEAPLDVDLVYSTDFDMKIKVERCRGEWEGTINDVNEGDHRRTAFMNCSGEVDNLEEINIQASEYIDGATGQSTIGRFNLANGANLLFTISSPDKTLGDVPELSIVAMSDEDESTQEIVSIADGIDTREFARPDEGEEEEEETTDIEDYEGDVAKTTRDTIVYMEPDADGFTIAPVEDGKELAIIEWNVRGQDMQEYARVDLEYSHVESSGNEESGYVNMEHLNLPADVELTPPPVEEEVVENYNPIVTYGVLGGLVAIGAGLIVWLKKRKKKKQQENIPFNDLKKR